MDLINKIIEKFGKTRITKKKLVNGLGIEQVGKSIFLIFQSTADKDKEFRVAKSIDGFNFELVRKTTDHYKKISKSEKFAEIIKPRSDYFDDGKIKIEGAFKTGRGKLIIYHSCNSENECRVGAALLSVKNVKKIIWRCEVPLWESSSSWLGKEINFIGLARVDGDIIGYWCVGKKQIQAVIYPSFRLREKKIQESVHLTLDKLQTNPIIRPKSKNKWEAFNTFNPAAVYVGGKVHILYRAQGYDYISVVGYATSKNGFTIEKRYNRPIYEPKEPFEWRGNKKFNELDLKHVSGGGYGGVEDPRITLVDNRIYMTYVAYNGSDLPRVALTSIALNDFLDRRWLWEKPVLISPPGVVDKGPAVFPEKINGKYVIMHRIFPDILIDFVDSLAFDGSTWLKGQYRIKTRPNMWDGGKIGTGAPPIKTKEGWLLIYYGTPYDYVKKPDAYNPYLIGAMLLDLNDPTKVLHRTKLPILSPTEDYENNGFKAGVVFPCGAVIINETLFVYYGGADSYVCVATADLADFLKKLTCDETPVLEKARIVKII